MRTECDVGVPARRRAPVGSVHTTKRGDKTCFCAPVDGQTKHGEYLRRSAPYQGSGEHPSRLSPAKPTTQCRQWERVKSGDCGRFPCPRGVRANIATVTLVDRDYARWRPMFKRRRPSSGQREHFLRRPPASLGTHNGHEAGVKPEIHGGSPCRRRIRAHRTTVALIQHDSTPL